MAVSWETVQLGNVVHTLKGYAFKSNHYTENGVPIVRVSNFTMDSISDNDLKFYSEDETKQFRKYELTTDDILIQTVGSWESNPASVVGKVVRVPQLLNGALLNQNIVKIFPVDKRLLNQQYIFYRLKCHDFKRHNIGSAVGAANQASITLDTIRAFTFNLPNITVQQRIADILRPYDDLIENNQKQIKLLEEAAQRLYKEWFVDLRFPGYETTPVVDGVPEGWTRGAVGNYIKKLPRTKQVMTGELLPTGTIPVIDQSKNFVAGYTDDKETIVDLENPVIVFGDHTRILKYIQFPFARGADGTQVIVSNCKRLPQSLFYHSLVNVDLSNYHYARHFKYLKAEQILIPTLDIARQYDDIVTPMFHQMQLLRSQCEIATEARNRLLPKLMSGEIEG